MSDATAAADRAFDPSASPLAVGATLAAGLIAVLVTGTATPAVLFTTVGAVALPAATATGSRRFLVLGAAAGLAGVFLAALGGLPPVLALVGTCAVVLAWDLGEHAVGLGRHVGRRAESKRATAVHVATSGGFAVALVAVATAVFRLARGGQSLAGAVVLAGAAALFALLIDR